MLVAAAFLAIALLQTWPLVTKLPFVLPNDLGDPVLNTWILWWNAHAVPLSTRWWNAPIFYPSPGAIAFSEVLLGLSVFASPLQWLGATPVLAYNLLFLVSFPLCAFFGYLLAWSLTRRVGPSIVAGTMYGFAVMRYAHVSHIQFQWTWWMPLALLGLHRWLTERRVSALILFVIAWVGQSLSNGYYFFYFSIIVGLWIAWFMPWHRVWQRDARRVLLPVLAAWAVGMAIVAPVMLGYQRIHARYGFTRSIGEIEAGSADLADFIRPSSVPRFLHVEPWERAECQVSLPMVGLCALAGALLTGGRRNLRRREPRPFSIAQSLVSMAAIVGMLAIVETVLLGRRHVHLFRQDLGSIPAWIVAVLALGLIALAFSPATERAWRARSPGAFFFGAVVVSIVLAMGPYPHVFGTKISNHSPYLALMSIVPGYTGLRVPARFVLITVLCLAIFTALTLARLHFTRAWREQLLFGVITAALLFETWPGPFRLVLLPPAGPEPAATSAAVLELPLDAGQGLNAMYRAMLHGRPIVDGYSGYVPPGTALLEGCFQQQDFACLDRFRRVVGPLEIMIERRRDPDRTWEHFVAALPDAQFRAREARFVVYHLPGRATLSTQPQGTARLVDARIEEMNSSVNAIDARAAFDHDLNTAWGTGRGQQSNDSVTIRLAESSSIGGIELQPGPSNPWDFPLALRIELSEDGQRWTRAWEDGTEDVRFARLMLEGVNACRITFPPQRGRFVRITETVDESARAWTIAELAVLRVP